jgi:hypothetical protein
MKKKRTFKKVKKVKVGGASIPAKYTKKGDSTQATKMAKEIKKFKGTKDSSAYFQWSGDTASNGKSYKTKVGKATLAMHKLLKKKK